MVMMVSGYWEEEGEEEEEEEEYTKSAWRCQACWYLVASHLVQLLQQLLPPLQKHCHSHPLHVLP